MTNKDLLERIEVWQNKGMFNPLTCGNNSRHNFLKGIIENEKVILICEHTDCHYKQTYLPQFLFEKDFNKFLKY